MEQTNENTQGAASSDQGSNVSAEVAQGNTQASADTTHVNAAPAQKPSIPDQPAKPAVDYEAKYKELQRAYTQETQRRSSWEKRWSAMESKLDEQARLLAESRKAPYDREKFLSEFQDKGPDALKPFWDEHLKSVEDKYSKGYSELQDANRRLQTRISLNERRSDSDNYPDFRKLEPVIVQLMDDPNCPVDFSKPMDQVIDVLYQLARQASSADAIKLAEEEGKRKAEANLVKESKTTVTGGGKAASITTPDLDKMNSSQLREYFVSLNGVVDRD